MKFRLSLSVNGNINVGVNIPSDQSSFEDYTSEKVAAAATEAVAFINNNLQSGETLSFYAEKFEDDGTPTGEKIDVTINKDTVDFINSAIGVQE